MPDTQRPATEPLLSDALADDSMLTVNILRSWDRARVERFALHLLGDDMQALVAEAEERGAARERGELETYFGQFVGHNITIAPEAILEVLRARAPKEPN